MRTVRTHGPPNLNPPQNMKYILCTIILPPSQKTGRIEFWILSQKTRRISFSPLIWTHVPFSLVWYHINDMYPVNDRMHVSFLMQYSNGHSRISDEADGMTIPSIHACCFLVWLFGDVLIACSTIRPRTLHTVRHSDRANGSSMADD